VALASKSAASGSCSNKAGATQACHFGKCSNQIKIKTNHKSLVALASRSAASGSPAVTKLVQHKHVSSATGQIRSKAEQILDHRQPLPAGQLHLAPAVTKLVQHKHVSLAPQASIKASNQMQSHPSIYNSPQYCLHIAVRTPPTCAKSLLMLSSTSHQNSTLKNSVEPQHLYCLQTAGLTSPTCAKSLLMLSSTSRLNSTRQKMRSHQRNTIQFCITTPASVTVLSTACTLLHRCTSPVQSHGLLLLLLLL
jgi:hypothetical protein